MRGILLDLDDTLVDDRSAMRAGVEALLAAHHPGQANREEHQAAWRASAERYWQRYEAGEISYLDQRRGRIRDFLGRSLDDAQADEALLPYVNAYESAWKLLPGVTEFLARTRHIPKVIVTNGEKAQQLRKVCATGLSEYVVGVVTPADCGQWKPHPAMFLAGLALLGVPAADCLMVGDSGEKDIEPARKLGMRAFHVEAGHDIGRLLMDA